MEIPRDQLPRLPKHRPAANGNGAAVDLLKVLLKMTSESHGVASKIIATVDDLEAIASDDKADVPALSGWRRELFGEKALKLKSGKIALAVKQNHVVALDKN
jgi:ribonuclease D